MFKAVKSVAVFQLTQVLECDLTGYSFRLYNLRRTDFHHNLFATVPYRFSLNQVRTCAPRGPFPNRP